MEEREEWVEEEEHERVVKICDWGEYVCFIVTVDLILMGLLASELDMGRHFWMDSWKNLEDPNGDIYGEYLVKEDNEHVRCR